jgi:hypothetical protein
MSSLEEVACVTYTTSKYSDIWPIHFGQLTKHLGGIKSYVLSDKGSGEKFDFRDHQLIEHDDNDPYYLQYTNGLDQIKEEYVIYLQDDFFLYDDVDHTKILNVLDFLKNSSYDFARMIRCGYQTPLDMHVKDVFYEVDMQTSDAFSMQATMWKKSRMRDLYTHVKSTKWLESEQWNLGCRNLGIKGTFTWAGESQIGKFHYDSTIWPYICTAICKGKWALDEYPEIMNRLIKEYNVDTSIRGVRKR